MQVSPRDRRLLRPQRPPGRRSEELRSHAGADPTARPAHQTGLLGGAVRQGGAAAKARVETRSESLFGDGWRGRRGGAEEHRELCGTQAGGREGGSTGTWDRPGGGAPTFYANAMRALDRR